VTAHGVCLLLLIELTLSNTGGCQEHPPVKQSRISLTGLRNFDHSTLYKSAGTRQKTHTVS
ncbi:MAG: hypothetical protein OXD49_02280, partial [Candidatus Poribacteria bacterium]|nr:hypothetical protein [Candidatus Poribacteria bacterium]